jgi:hypothetical protein
MIVKVKNMRLDLDKISFLEYDPAAKWKDESGKEFTGAGLFVIDGMQFTIKDPAATQLVKAWEWQYRDQMYDITEGDKKDWVNIWKKNKGDK